MTIRQTTADDALALRALRRRALTLHPPVFGADITEEERHPERFWQERATGSDRQAIFVAVDDDGALVGMAGMVGDGRIKTGHVAMLWGVFVVPEARGQGLSHQLVEAALHWARAAGFARVKLAVLVDNAAALCVYLRCGFTVYGVEPDVIRVAGVGHDELLMTRPL